jgi:putative hydrolase of the HAD superfamily
MFPFDVILFDVGGVLLTNGWDHRERAAVVEQFHLDRDALEAHHPEPYDAWERGAITAADYMNAAVFYEPRSFSPGEFFAAICAQSVELADGALGILKEVSASHPCRVGALNNEALETNEYRLERFGLRAYLEFAFTSCYMGLRKPEPAIYRRVLGILGKPAERTLFIDDRAENAAGAASVGMKTIRFTGAVALRRELQSLGVL